MQRYKNFLGFLAIVLFTIISINCAKSIDPVDGYVAPPKEESNLMTVSDLEIIRDSIQALETKLQAETNPGNIVVLEQLIAQEKATLELQSAQLRVQQDSIIADAESQLATMITNGAPAAELAAAQEIVAAAKADKASTELAITQMYTVAGIEIPTDTAEAESQLVTAEDITALKDSALFFQAQISAETNAPAVVLLQQQVALLITQLQSLTDRYIQQHDSIVNEKQATLLYFETNGGTPEDIATANTALAAAVTHQEGAVQFVADELAQVGITSSSTEEPRISIGSVIALRDSIAALEVAIAAQTEIGAIAALTQQKSETLVALQTLIQEYKTEQELLVAAAEADLANLLVSGGTPEQIASAKEAVANAESTQKSALSNLTAIEAELELLALSSDSGGVVGASSTALADSSTLSSSIQTSSTTDSTTLSSVASVSSGAALSSSSVVPVNSAPVIDTGATLLLSMVEDGDLGFTITASDSNGDTLSWRLIDSTDYGTVIVLDKKDTVEFAYKPQSHFFGEEVIAFEVSDQQAFDTITITITITNTNDLPEYAGTPVITGVDFNAEKELTMNNGGTCTDLLDSTSAAPTFSYTWYRDDDNTGYNGDSIAVDSLYTAVTDDVNSYLYGVVACIDDSNAVVTLTTDYSAVIKTRINIPPTGSTVLINIEEDKSPYFIGIKASNSDGDPIHWTEATVPDWATLVVPNTIGDSVTVTLTIDSLHFYGALPFSVWAHDGIDSVEIAVSVNVDAMNDAPQMSDTATIVGIAMNSETLNLDTVGVNCVDSIDNEAVTISWDWFSTSDTTIYSNSTLGSGMNYRLTGADINSYLYVILSCADGDTAVFDTTDFTSIIIDIPNTEEKLLNFDAVDSEYVDLGSLQSDWTTTGITVEAWVNWHDTLNTTFPRIFEMGNVTDSVTPNENFAIAQESGSSRLALYIHDGLTWKALNADNFIMPNKWTHVAVTVNTNASDNATIYKNGKVVATGTMPVPTNSARDNVAIGKSNFDNDSYFDGQIDELRIWGSVRSVSEINNNMFTTYETLTDSTGIVAYYDFSLNPLIESMLYDVRGNYHGTLMNMEIGDWQNEFDTFTLEVTDGSNGSITPSAGFITMAETQQVSITATPDTVFDFDSWAVGGAATVGNVNAPATYVELSGDGSLEPAFVADVEGNSLKFFGGDDYVDLGTLNIDWSGGFTIEAWVNWQDNLSYSRIFECSQGVNSQNDNIIFSIGERDHGTGKSDSLSFRYLHGITGWDWHEVKANNYIPDVELNTWIHVAVVVGSNYAVLYKNGNEFARVTNSKFSNKPVTESRANCYLGKSTWTGNVNSKFQLDEFRIWTKVRTVTQIRNNMDNSLVGDETGLVVYYDFNHPSGTANFANGAPAAPNYTGTLTTMDNVSAWIPATWADGLP